MMVKHEDERAFPVTMEDGRGESMTNLGMTLRDYFAAKSINGMLSALDAAGLSYSDPVMMAEHAYAMADAMLAERAK